MVRFELHVASSHPDCFLAVIIDVILSFGPFKIPSALMVTCPFQKKAVLWPRRI